MTVPSSDPRWRRGGVRAWVLWGTLSPPVITRQDAVDSKGALYAAERYRDSLLPGSAARDGAESLVAHLRTKQEPTRRDRRRGTHQASATG
jgi:hypothetical protein